MRVHLIDAKDRLETTLRLRIEAVLHAEPAPEPITFDTLVDPTTDDIVVRPGNVVLKPLASKPGEVKVAEARLPTPLRERGWGRPGPSPCLRRCRV